MITIAPSYKPVIWTDWSASITWKIKMTKINNLLRFWLSIQVLFRHRIYKQNDPSEPTHIYSRLPHHQLDAACAMKCRGESHIFNLYCVVLFLLQRAQDSSLPVLQSLGGPGSPSPRGCCSARLVQTRAVGLWYAVCGAKHKVHVAAFVFSRNREQCRGSPAIRDFIRLPAFTLSTVESILQNTRTRAFV